MSFLSLGLALSALTPLALMTLVAVRGRLWPADEPPAAAWTFFRRAAALALAAALLTVLLQLLRQWHGLPAPVVEGLWLSPLSAWVALLVQFLGTVIGVFSSRYLHGEPGQGRYMARLAGVLAGVHLLLLADHWLVLIAAWAAVGLALQHLLCFYTDRPFALLAAHKKRVADRLADLLLLAAAGAVRVMWRAPRVAALLREETGLDPAHSEARRPRRGRPPASSSSSRSLARTSARPPARWRTSAFPTCGWSSRGSNGRTRRRA